MRPKVTTPSSILDLGMKLHVPYNNDFALLAEIAPLAPYIRALYLPCDGRLMGCGRYDRQIARRNWDQYDRELGLIFERLEPLGIEVNVLFNAPYVSNEVLAGFATGPIAAYVRRQLARGLRWVTIANLELARCFRRYFPSLNIDVSTVAYVNSVQRAVYWHRAVRPAMLCVDIDHGRNVALLREIRKATGIPLKIIANSACLTDCPSKWTHAFHSQEGERGSFDCWPMRARFPWQAYRGQIIPPYYLRHLAGLVADVKLVDRSAPTGELVEIIRWYALDRESRHFVPRGGVLEGEGGLPTVAFNLSRLHAEGSKHPWFRALPEKIFRKTGACTRRCETCGECYATWKQDWRVLDDLDVLRDHVARTAATPEDLSYASDLLEQLHAQRHDARFLRRLSILQEHCAAPLREVVHYLLGLAWTECGEEATAAAHAAAVRDPALRRSLDAARAALAREPFDRYLPFDEDDPNSFLALRQLRGSDTLEARARRADFYLTARAPELARAAVAAIPPAMDPDLEYRDRFIAAALRGGLYPLAIEIIRGIDPAALTAPRLTALAFAQYRTGAEWKEAFLAAELSLHDAPPATALLHPLLALRRAAGRRPPTPRQIGSLLAEANGARAAGDLPRAGEMLELLVAVAPSFQPALVAYHDVLVALDRRDAAASVAAQLARAPVSPPRPAAAITAPDPPPPRAPAPAAAQARPRRRPLELRALRSPSALRAFLAANSQHDPVAVTDPKAQHFFSVLLAGEPVGFVELYHVAGDAEARLRRTALDQDVRDRIDEVALLELAARRARRLGAGVLVAETRAPSAALQQQGWLVRARLATVARRLD
jgi:hypothetical protein